MKRVGLPRGDFVRDAAVGVVVFAVGLAGRGGRGVLGGRSE